MCTCMLHYFFATCCFMAIFLATNGAVTVNVELNQDLPYNPDDEVVISCTYMYSPGTDTLFSVQWLNGMSRLVANYNFGISSLSCPASPDYEPPAYTMSTVNIDSGSNLTISRAKFADRGNYKCRVEVVVTGHGLVSFEATKELIIHVNVTIEMIELELGPSNAAIGGELTVTKGEKMSMTLIVPGIFPAATFEWKLHTEDLPDTTQNKTDAIGLFTSTSNTTFTPAILNNGKQVTCAVTVGNEAPVELGIAQLAVTVAPSRMNFSWNNEVHVQNNSQVTLNEKSVLTAVVHVHNIYPSVQSFKWTVNGTQLPAHKVERLHDVVNGSGLINSSSTATLALLQEYNGTLLGCQALDISGEETIAHYVVLISVQDGPSGCDAVCIAGIIAAVAALIGIGIGIGIGIRNYTNRDKAKPDKPDTSTTKENTSGDETHRLSKRKLITSGDETHRLSKLITSGDETHRLSKLITS